LFVSIDLLETLIPSSICFVDTNLITILQVLHIHFEVGELLYLSMRQLISMSDVHSKKGEVSPSHFSFDNLKHDQGN
jgi:hypothetical protein